MAKIPAVALDLKRGPIYFKSKRFANEARDEAKAYGLKIRLTKTSWGWKLSKA